MPRSEESKVEPASKMAAALTESFMLARAVTDLNFSLAMS